MAIQFTDFSRAPLLDSPWGNMLENVLKGYQISKEPAKMAEEQKQRELTTKLKDMEVQHKPTEYKLSDQEKGLANALKSKALEHYEEKFALERDLKKAQIQKALQTKVGGSPKANGELANFMVSHPDATQEEIRNAYDEIHSSKQAHTDAITNRSRDITAGSSFDKLPTNEKKRAVGLTTAMGIDPIEGTQLLRSGKSLQDIADANGKKLDELTPMYPMGEENVKQLQRRSGFVNEIKNLEKNLAGATGKYQNKIFGYSFEQAADALSGDNPDEQGKVLAARALQPELTALRLKVAGGNIGIEAIRELQDKSLGNLKVFESLVDTKTYLAMQKYMTKYLEEAANEYQRTMEDYGRLKSPSQMRVFDLSTGEYE
ncbi:hypothetical protein [Legionella maceachernii]|uniref:Uncharacterized protein n=1 Tax=Legionella maceachernii TaxID=466 RepID=A0A0W0WBC7_9GAMM|nr:hypothetical protein [Legionella maceachernii]KTD29669.1 hypothetical protein Lmac_0844 [Legionella maceachernii]SKA20977.1 hypothetical protein SAMN02745128_02587 [Legionella maceachernii]SUP02610.1 Uncharacterised protein [Legionella maceachernii]